MPDIYQGAELWDLSLVDPDNRRPVDYELRQRLLEETENELAQSRGEAMSRFMDDRYDGPSGGIRLGGSAATVFVPARPRKPSR